MEGVTKSPLTYSDPIGSSRQETNRWISFACLYIANLDFLGGFLIHELIMPSLTYLPRSDEYPGQGFAAWIHHAKL